MGPMPKIRSRGRSAAVIPADRPVDARLKRPSRGHFSHTFSAVASAKATCCSRERRFHRRVVWADAHDAFNRSRGRLAAGKASDQSGVVVRHTTTSRVLGGWILRYRVGSRDLLLKERLSYRLMIRTDGPDAADPVGRPTSGRKLGKLPPESSA